VLPRRAASTAPHPVAVGVAFGGLLEMQDDAGARAGVQSFRLQSYVVCGSGKRGGK
jgi:hypothetical protein